MAALRHALNHGDDGKQKLTPKEAAAELLEKNFYYDDGERNYPIFFRRSTY